MDEDSTSIVENKEQCEIAALDSQYQEWVKKLDMGDEVNPGLTLLIKARIIKLFDKLIGHNFQLIKNARLDHTTRDSDYEYSHAKDLVTIVAYIRRLDTLEKCHVDSMLNIKYRISTPPALLPISVIDTNLITNTDVIFKELTKDIKDSGFNSILDYMMHYENGYHLMMHLLNRLNVVRGHD